MRLDHFEVERRIERQQSSLVQLNTRFQKRPIGTREYNARIDKLLALHFWYDANDRVVIPELIAHESPPPESSEAPHDASTSIRRTLLYSLAWSGKASFQPSSHPEQDQQPLGSFFRSSLSSLDHPQPRANSQTEAECAA